MKTIFTPQVFALISNLVEQGLSAAEIAEKIGCTVGSLRVRCSQHGIRLRRRAKFNLKIAHSKRLMINLSGNVADRIKQQADKLGISATKFAANLIETIVRDNLYDAVLDHDVDINSHSFTPRPPRLNG
jgi:macrodomain Ter protein organizer (MatP/YcbG family)